MGVDPNHGRITSMIQGKNARRLKMINVLATTKLDSFLISRVLTFFRRRAYNSCLSWTRIEDRKEEEDGVQQLPGGAPHLEEILTDARTEIGVDVIHMISEERYLTPIISHVSSSQFHCWLLDVWSEEGHSKRAARIDTLKTVFQTAINRVSTSA